MKKGAVKFSGVLTLIVFLVLTVCSALVFLDSFGIEAITNLIVGNQIVGTIYAVAFECFVFPWIVILSKVGLAVEMAQTIGGIIFLVTSLGMFVWGIKEITIAKKSDEDFAKCKKTCAFMMVVKALFVVYAVAVCVLFGFVDVLGVAFQEDIAMLCKIALIALAVLFLICFLLPVIAFNKASKFVGQGNFEQQPMDYNNGQPVDMQQNMGYAPYQANMPGAMPQMQPQGPQPIDPATLVQNQQQTENNGITIIPGQDGVPLNITQKGIDDLVRLERLRASGSIDENNYLIMKNKICSMNLA